MARRITIQPVNRNLVVISGHGSRELITEVRNGRPPCWLALSRGWSTQPHTAADVIALAESRHFEVVVLPEGDPAAIAMGVLFS